MKELDWSDVDEIAFRLSEAHPEVDPITIRFTDLHAWICKLKGFTGEPTASNERILEAIQAAWVDEVEDGPTTIQ